MIRALLLVVAVAIAASVPLFSQELYATEFQRFQDDFNITYTPEEAWYRLSVFQKNFDYIESFNKKEDAEESGIRLAVNAFAAMTFEEFSGKMKGFKRMSGVSNATLHEESDHPASIDWTTKGAVTPVKNQGQCGSCWTFSVTGTMEGAIAIQTGKLTSLSEQDLVDCGGKYSSDNDGCNGGDMEAALEYVEKQGLATEEAYKYTARDGKCHSYTPAPHTMIKGYKVAKAYSQSALASAVAVGPVSIAVDAEPSWWQFYSSGVVDKKCGTELDHGVLMVGYGTDAKQGDFWKIKNSWGTGWGEGGYIRLKRTSSGAGMCGVTLEASYPVL